MIKELFDKYTIARKEADAYSSEIAIALGVPCTVTQTVIVVDDKLDNMTKMIIFESSGVTYQAWETSIDGVKVVYYEAL